MYERRGTLTHISPTDISINRLTDFTDHILTTSVESDACHIAWVLGSVQQISYHYSSSPWLHVEPFLILLTLMFLSIHPSAAYSRLCCRCSSHLCMAVEELGFSRLQTGCHTNPSLRILSVFLFSTEFKADNSLHSFRPLTRKAINRIETDKNCAVYRRKNMIQVDNCQTLKKWICKKNATLLVLWAKS